MDLSQADVNLHTTDAIHDSSIDDREAESSSQVAVDAALFGSRINHGADVLDVWFGWSLEVPDPSKVQTNIDADSGAVNYEEFATVLCARESRS